MLALLAAGLSNKQIAAELYLSTATVERHLATVYRNLGLGRAGGGGPVRDGERARRTVAQPRSCYSSAGRTPRRPGQKGPRTRLMGSMFHLRDAVNYMVAVIRPGP